MVVWNYADFDDYRKFPAKTMTADSSASRFHFATNQPGRANVIAPRQIEVEGEKIAFDSFLREQKTAAFLIIRNDTIYYERYFRGYSKGQKLTSFSVAKSFVSALVGVAIANGTIGSVNDTVTTYLPELSSQGFDSVTIRNLLNMRSGIAFSENYQSPFSDVARYYYGPNLNKYLKKLEVVREPGKVTRYQSANTQLLGRLLAAATGSSLTSYLESQLWHPIGMQYPGTWSTDSKRNQTEKAFCCLNTTARNFARFGRLYLQKGIWQNDTVVPPAWVESSTTVRDKAQNFEYYYHWWHCIDTRPVSEGYDSSMTGPLKKLKYARKAGGKQEKYVVTPCPAFYARGFKGQYVYIAPEKDLLILRFGPASGDFDWPDFFQAYAASLANRTF